MELKQNLQQFKESTVQCLVPSSKSSIFSTIYKIEKIINSDFHCFELEQVLELQLGKITNPQITELHDLLIELYTQLEANYNLCSKSALDLHEFESVQQLRETLLNKQSMTQFLTIRERQLPVVRVLRNELAIDEFVRITYLLTPSGEIALCALLKARNIANNTAAQFFLQQTNTKPIGLLLLQYSNFDSDFLIPQDFSIFSSDFPRLRSFQCKVPQLGEFEIQCCEILNVSYFQTSYTKKA